VFAIITPVVLNTMVFTIFLDPFRTTVYANFLFIAFKSTKATQLLGLIYTQALILSIKPKITLHTLSGG